MAHPCMNGDHPAVRTPITIFLTMPGESRYDNDRYRAKYCSRHGRQLLCALYKAAVDSSMEAGEPEFCFGCGEPATAIPFELAFYENDWFARFDAVLCEHCALGVPGALGEALRTAEKQPRRDGRSSRPLRR